MLGFRGLAYKQQTLLYSQKALIDMQRSLPDRRRILCFEQSKMNDSQDEKINSLRNELATMIADHNKKIASLIQNRET